MINWPDLGFCLLNTTSQNEFRFLQPTLRNIHAVAKLAQNYQPILQHSILRWLLKPETVAERLRDPNLALYGMFVEQNLAGFGLLRAFQTDLVVEGAFVCTAPRYQREGLATDIILGGTLIADMTPAILFYADAVSSHVMSQKALESVGCIPVGILPNFEKFGSECDRFGPNETLIRYVRFPHNNPGLWLERMKGAKLTPLAARLYKTIEETLLEIKSDENNEEHSYKLAG
jgi:hypothetical protein